MKKAYTVSLLVHGSDVDERRAARRCRAAALRRARGMVGLSPAPGSGLAWTVLGAAASVLVVALAVRLTQRAA